MRDRLSDVPNKTSDGPNETESQRRARLIKGFASHFYREFEKLNAEMATEKNEHIRIGSIAYRCLPKNHKKKDGVIEAYQKGQTGELGDQALVALGSLVNYRHEILLMHGDSWENCLSRDKVSSGIAEKLDILEGEVFIPPERHFPETRLINFIEKAEKKGIITPVDSYFLRENIRHIFEREGIEAFRRAEAAAQAVKDVLG